MHRIVIVSNSYSGGGAELVSRILANAIDSTEYHCTLVTINDWPDDQAVIPIEVFRINRKYKGGIIDLARSIIRFRRAIRVFKPDILILNCELPELFSIFTSNKIRRIVVEHTSNPWASFKALGFFVRNILNLLGAVWVRVSIDQKIWIAKDMNQHYIPNPSVHVMPDSNFAQDKIERLFFLGRLTSIKQPSFIIEASRNTGVPSLLVGEGPEMKNLKMMAEEIGVFVGFHGHSNLPWNLLRPGDVVIVPSKFEGDGLVVSEAIIANVPILLMDIPDLRRFNLPDVNYFADQTELNQKILEYSDCALQLVPSEQARLHQIRERNPDMVAQKWKNLCDKMLRNP